jgi:tol-pal system protein YbgF
VARPRQLRLLQPANNGQLQDITLGATPAAQPPGAAAPPRAPSGAPPPNWTPSPAQPAPPAAAAAEAAPPASAGDEKADYDQAFSALKDGRYAESARRFQAFISQYPNSELTPNSYYWLGESYYVTQNYPISLDTFQKLLAQYPNSQKAPDALLKVGYLRVRDEEVGPGRGDAQSGRAEVSGHDRGATGPGSACAR